MDRGTVVVWEVTVSAAGAVNLAQLEGGSDAPWLTAALGSPGRTTRTVTLTASTADLVGGRYGSEVSLQVPGVPVLTVPVAVGVFQPVHAGPAADTCPHEEPGGGENTTCDFTGSQALSRAADVLNPYEHLIIYDGGRRPAIYEARNQGEVALPANTWISSAAGVEPENVVLRCRRNRRALRLAGDGVRIERFTILSAGQCDRVITTWEDGPEDGTGGHEIDRMIVAALSPERFGANSIRFAFGLSEETSLTNSHVYGYWEGVGNLSFADNTKIVGNTFVFYQRDDSAMVASGVDGLRVVNNVFVVLPGADGPLVQADSETTRLVVSGNVIEGYPAPVVADYNVEDPTNTIARNTASLAGLESPLRPRFLQRVEPPVSGEESSVGTSLDGVDVDGKIPALPGAFQRRSALTDRPDGMRLGPPNCGAACDLLADEVDNPVQVAAWSLWPGKTLRLEPGTYAGSVVVSWPINIEGTGARLADVVLRHDLQDPLWEAGDLWDPHRAVIAVLYEANGTTIQNLRIETGSGRSSEDLDYALFVEGQEPGGETSGPRVIVRTVVVNAAADLGSDPASAIRTGDRVLIQDALIQGGWGSCGRVSSREARGSTPEVVSDFINVTCRLTGSSHAGFDLGDVRGARFINVIAETGSPAGPLFRAYGDGSFPKSFAGHAVHYVGFSSLFGGFTPADGMYAVDTVEELLMSPFVDSPTGGLLRSESPPIDSGVPPTVNDNLWPPDVAPGRSVNGVDRSGVMRIDRGAYEQGQ